MSWTAINADDYGWVGKLTIVQDGTAQDISGYTTRQYILTDPNGNDATVTALFDTDGTDGVLKYTFQSGDIDEAGNWTVRARLADGASTLTSARLKFPVDPA